MGYVKIVDADNHRMWYHGKIGQVFRVKNKFKFLSYWMSKYGGIYKEDCKTVQINLWQKLLVLFGYNKINVN